MAKKISQLDDLTTELTGEEQSVLIANGQNYRFKLRNLKFLLKDLTKADVGLNNVDNTSDADKPLSIATQKALRAKASVMHEHASDEIIGLGEIIDARVSEALQAMPSGADISVSFSNSEW